MCIIHLIRVARVAVHYGNWCSNIIHVYTLQYTPVVLLCKYEGKSGKNRAKSAKKVSRKFFAFWKFAFEKDAF